MTICAWIETSSAENRLVADDQARVERERPGDADALALAARELVRVAVDEVGVEADHLEQPLDALPARAAVADPVHDERLADDVADGHPRVERGVRVLKDDLHLAPHLAELFALQLRQFAAEEIDRALGRLQELEHAVARRRLAGAGLADETERLAG